jgi:hypothetical protein
LSITHHTRKRPSTGPRTTHGPQSPPWWVHWQHTHIVTREKRKRKETNKKKLQQAIESQRKAKSKITWRRTNLGPLRQGQRLDTSETKPCSSKEHKPPNQSSNNTKSSPCTYASSPWAKAHFPLKQCSNATWECNKEQNSTQLAQGG